MWSHLEETVHPGKRKRTHAGAVRLSLAVSEEQQAEARVAGTGGMRGENKGGVERCW